MSFLSGKNDDVEWEVQSSFSDTFGQYSALVRVGTTYKVTGLYDLLSDAMNAGCQLLADTLAELGDLVNVS